VPVANLYALPVLFSRLTEQKLGDIVVASPDPVFAAMARRYASRLGATVAIADKKRVGHDEKAEVLDLIGEVEGKTALIVDDFTISGGTLVDAARKLQERGAKKICAMVSHGVFSENSMEKLDESPIEKLFMTDSVEGHRVELSDKIEIVPVAPLFGEAIKRIHNRESISEMFPEW
jgi:ribose-phosphate pyrophosphokinase